MGIQQMALLSIALNLDMFGVSLLMGTMISRAKIILPMSMIIAFFLTLMPLTGYGIGNAIGNLIGPVSSHIGAGLLIIVGIELIRETIFSSSNLLNNSNLVLLYLGKSRV
jgi:manganese efflux pump family protein